MKKLLTSSLILFALNLGCQSKQVGPPPVIPYCGFINEGTPYGYCRPSDNGSDRWRVSLDKSQSGKWVMTTTEGYAKAWEYGERVKKYIEYLEKKVKDLQKGKR